MPPQFDSATDFHRRESNVSKKSAFQVIQIIIHLAPYFEEGPTVLLMDGVHLAECVAQESVCVAAW